MSGLVQGLFGSNDSSAAIRAQQDAAAKSEQLALVSQAKQNAADQVQVARRPRLGPDQGRRLLQFTNGLSDKLGT